MISEESIDKKHYYNPEYLKRERIYSFAEQIELVKKYTKSSDTILEVGKGTGLLSHFLTKYFDYSVKTLDTNPQLKPDFVDDIINPQSLQEKSFDVVTCFEVLEHMKLTDSRKALQNIYEVAMNYLIVSFPDMRYFFGINFSLFGTRYWNIGKIFSTKRLKNKNNTFVKDHFWEIGVTKDEVDYKAKFIKKVLFKDMQIIEDYRCFQVPWHHYYVIKVV